MLRKKYLTDTFIDMKQKINTLALVNTIAQQLSTVYPDTILCTQYAWWTLEHITQKKQAQLLADQTISLTEQQQLDIDHWIKKMVDEHMPIQYLIGSVPFCDITICVEPPILIPRPETEEWCFELISLLKKLPASQQNLRILDLCSGSGCIALALAQAFPQATVIGTDISEDALMLSRKNAKHNNISNVTFIKSDLFDTLPQNTQFDLIVSNPPYIPERVWKTLDPSVTTWEDKQALIANDDGLALIKRIIKQAPQFLQLNSVLKKYQFPELILEIDYDQSPKVVELFKAATFTHVTVHKDLEGKGRTVWGARENVAVSKNKH